MLGAVLGPSSKRAEFALLCFLRTLGSRPSFSTALCTSHVCLVVSHQLVGLRTVPSGPNAAHHCFFSVFWHGQGAENVYEHTLDSSPLSRGVDIASWPVKPEFFTAGALYSTGFGAPAQH